MVPDEVRLLHLQPASYFGYAIICSLTTLPQNVAETRYEALSYVWGVYEAENLRPITVDCKVYQITRNLHSALHHLRSSTPFRSLWVDAVCLDQNNLEEKNWTVPNMHIVYGSARSVIAWVGKADSDTTVALDLAKTLAKGWRRTIESCIERRRSGRVFSKFDHVKAIEWAAAESR